jgi:hypothetical protein
MTPLQHFRHGSGRFGDPQEAEPGETLLDGRSSEHVWAICSSRSGTYPQARARVRPDERTRQRDPVEGSLGID